MVIAYGLDVARRSGVVGLDIASSPDATLGRSEEELVVVNCVPDQPRLVGPFQQLVLLAVIRIGPDCHGGAVHRFIEHRTGRWISVKAVYTTLQRLERRGYLRSWSRPPLRSRWMSDWRRPGAITLVRAARRFYSMQTLGRRALRLTLQATNRMSAGLPGLGRENELYRDFEASLSPRPFVVVRYRHPEGAEAERWEREANARFYALYGGGPGSTDGAGRR